MKNLHSASFRKLSCATRTAARECTSWRDAHAFDASGEAEYAAFVLVPSLLGVRRREIPEEARDGVKEKHGLKECDSGGLRG